MTYSSTSRGFKKLNAKPANKLFSEVMAVGRKYVIPRFQRDYSCKNENWEELWQDIEAVVEDKVQHFIGFLVLQTQDDKTFQVIDGQQRLVTISILIAAAISRLQDLVACGLQPADNQARIEHYKKAYIGALNTVSLNIEPKLSLNRHSEQHYSHLTQAFSIAKQSNLMVANKNINDAFTYFQGNMKRYESGTDVAKIIESVANGLLFTVITVGDDLDAYTIFEALNAKRMPLAIAGLIKNYLLSTMAKNDSYSEVHFSDWEERWKSLVEQLGEAAITNFLRSYHELGNELANKKKLFSALKEEVQLPEQVGPYLKDLQKYASIYVSQQNKRLSF